MNNFEKMCNEAATRFIKTVAIIDDEATYDLKLSSQMDKHDVKVAIPPVMGIVLGKEDTSASIIHSEKTEESTQEEFDILSQLDAKTLINAFADLGIACCIQRPEHEDEPLDRAVRLAASVDVLIIDWVLAKDDRSLSRNILKKILEDDKNAGYRMRLIVVYTSHNYIDQMLDDIKQDADEVYADDLLVEKEKSLILNDCLRIVILNKEITRNPPSKARIVPFNKLPEIIISEYSAMMKGIIPGATLHGIAAIRENTHKLLSILNSSLDGAYCCHRALIKEPSDSVDFAMNLITNEIDTIIQKDKQARQFVDENGIKGWLEQYANGKDKITYRNSSLSVRTIEDCILKGSLSKNDGFNNIQKEYALNWVQAKNDAHNDIQNINGEIITLDAAKDLIKQNKWDSIKKCQPPAKIRFVEALYPSVEEAGNGCNELSHLQCTIRDMGNRLYNNSQNPTLQLGTILKAQTRDSNEFFLCLTPLCDCVRLEEEFNFLFLKLHSGKKDLADIIIKIQDGTFEPLILKKNKLKIQTIPFKPIEGNDRINLQYSDHKWTIESNGISYQWIGELRYPKALAIAHHVAANASRVGIDEFEWLRLQATLKE